MGEYFDDAKPKAEEDEDEKLITNFNSLCSAYNVLVDKIQTITNEGYEAIMPIRTELTGSKKTPDDIGQIGKLRRKIEMSRIWRMEIGMEMYSALKNIEDLDRWSERYIKYIEDNMDGLKLICKSAFKIIIDLHKEVDNQNAKILRMEDQIVMTTGPIPAKAYIPAKVVPPREIKKYEKKTEQKELKDVVKPGVTEESQIESEHISQPKKEKKRRITAEERRRNEKINAPVNDEFKKMLNEHLTKYMNMEKIGDNKKKNHARLRAYGICGLSIPKRKFVEEELNKLDLKKV